MNRLFPQSNLNLMSLTEAVAAETGLSLDDAQEVVQSTLDVMGRTLAAGHSIRLSNFGSFSVGERYVPGGALGGLAGPARMVKIIRFRATGRLLAAVRAGLPVTTLKKNPKSR